MERYRLPATFNGGLSQRPISQTNPPSFISLPHKPHLTEPPFSSYLRPEAPKSTTSEDRIGYRIDDTEINIFEAEQYFNEGHDHEDDTKKKTIILNGITERCDLSMNTRESSVSSLDGYGRNCRNGSFRATPTASSEASWNSRTGLLKNPQGSVAVSVRAFPLNEQKKVSASTSSTKWFFRRKCPCSGKKSVDVEEKHSEPKSPIRSNFDFNGSLSTNKQSSKAGEVGINGGKGAEEVAKLKLSATNWAKDQEIFCGGSGRLSPEKHFPAEIGHRIVNSGRPFNDRGGFSFPILNPPVTNSLDDPARDSLEVFRPSEEPSALRKSSEFHKPSPILPFPARKVADDDDMASDTSSELFEIESLSTQMASYPMYRRRDSLNEMSSFDPRKFVGNSAGILQFRRSLEEAAPSIAASECYAPSEVSVEWSVTTAEGFDRASVANYSSAASDYGEIRFIQAEHDRFAASMAVTAGGGKRRGNGLLSCRCEKAVSVGPQPVRLFGPEQGRMGGPVLSVEPDRGLGKGRLGNGSLVHERTGLSGSQSARMCRPVGTRERPRVF